jgi:hypothetical protein
MEHDLLALRLLGVSKRLFFYLEAGGGSIVLDEGSERFSFLNISNLPFALGHAGPLLLVDVVDGLLELLSFLVQLGYLSALSHVPDELVLLVDLLADLAQQSFRFLVLFGTLGVDVLLRSQIVDEGPAADARIAVVEDV